MSKLMRAAPSDFARQMLLDIMGNGGLMERDGFLVKPEQRDYAQRWALTIGEGLEGRFSHDLRSRLLMLGAETGTGKTIGFALPAMAFASAYHLRVGIATHSHHLQRQMLGDEKHPGDLRIINDWLSRLGLRKLKIACRFGAQAFISASAIYALRENLDRDDATRHQKTIDSLDRLYAWALDANDGCTSGMLEDARLIMDDGQLPVPASEICVGVGAPDVDRAAYQRHLAECEGADVTLFTHHFLASQALFRSRSEAFGFDLLVIDEADQLTHAADSVFRDCVSIRRAMQSVTEHSGPAGANAVQAMARFYSLCLKVAIDREDLTAVPLSKLARAIRSDLTAAAAQAGVALKTLSRSIRAAQESAEIAKIAQSLTRFAGSQEGDFFMSALSFSSSRLFPSINMVPASAGRLLRQIWRRNSDAMPPIGVLFTSATLAVPGSSREPLDRFKESARQLGVPVRSTEHEVVDANIWAQFEPRVFGRACFILADPAIPEPLLYDGMDDEQIQNFNPRWLKYLASMVLRAHESNRRTLVLVNSYAECEALGKELTGQGVVAIAQRHEHGAMKRCEAEFLACGSAIWISPTAWDGLNLPGMIPNLVVSRIPFSPVDLLERTLMTERGHISHASVDGILYGQTMNMAKRKLRQGLGRPIRSSTDRARIFIADPRFPLPTEVLIRQRGKLFVEPGTRCYAAFHSVIPVRFAQEFRNAAVYLESGSMA